MTSLPTICALGEILVDHFPDGKRLGGAPFNFISHLHRLSFPMMFVTRIGRDEDGKEILRFFSKLKMDQRFVQIDDERLTGAVTVHFHDDGTHAFTAHENRSQDYLVDPKNLEENMPQALFFGTFGQRHEVAASTHQRILSKMKGRAQLFCDLNIRPPYYTKEIVERSLHFCDVLKISDEDISFLEKIFSPLPRTSEDVVKMFMDRYEIPKVYLTLGSCGSILFDGTEKLKVSATKVDVVNTVGAGDAYVAMIVAGEMLHWKPEVILQRASEFAAAICEEAAAIPAKDEFYNRFRGWFLS